MPTWESSGHVRLGGRSSASLGGQWRSVRWAGTHLEVRHIAGICAILAIACYPIVKKQRRTARWEERPIRIENTIEYKTAKWLDGHIPGQRVFAPGSIGFWLNAFSDAPQITGGFDNGISNPTVPAVIFHAYAGADQQSLVDLLRSYGCDALIGGGKDSAEFYHPISHAEKLRGLIV